jgi:hypothetical protein
MSKGHLCVGGPKTGEWIDWDSDRFVVAIPQSLKFIDFNDLPDPLEEIEVKTGTYTLERIGFDNHRKTVWVYEDVEDVILELGTMFVKAFIETGD